MRRRNWRDMGPHRNEPTVVVGRVRRMGAEDVPAALALSRAESWGFDRSDFRRILELWPGGSFVWERDERVIGMVTTSAYQRTGWIGNVLVEQPVRGQGIGSALVRRAVEHLEHKGLSTLLLYAYSGLEDFYRGFGFRPMESYISYRGRISAGRRKPTAEPMVARDLKDVCTIDRHCFGDDRSRLIGRIFKEFAEMALVARSQGDVVGYLLATVSDVVCNIGPGISMGSQATQQLLESAAVLLDGRDCFLASPATLGSSGIVGLGLRPGFKVTRMSKGPRIRDDRDAVLAVGGLEKG